MRFIVMLFVTGAVWLLAGTIAEDPLRGAKIAGAWAIIHLILIFVLMLLTATDTNSSTPYARVFALITAFASVPYNLYAWGNGATFGEVFVNTLWFVGIGIALKLIAFGAYKFNEFTSQ